MTTREKVQGLKKYIGDGCYVSFDGFSLWLTTEDGISVQNVVCLEPDVFADLVRYARERGIKVPS